MQGEGIIYFTSQCKELFTAKSFSLLSLAPQEPELPCDHVRVKEFD